MALPIALNRDPFLSGGVMDAPDLTVRTAMNKLAWGMPISQKEARRITERQGLEQQSINVAQADAQKQALMGLKDVNVGSYAGSMWSPQGSYTAPRANQETIADLLLKQRFGTFEQGQVRGTINPQGYAAAVAAGPNTGPVTTPSTAPMTQPAPIPKASAINSVMGLEGMENILPQTPTAQGYGGVAQGIPSATQASPSVRTVSAVPQMGTPQLPPALQQLLGGQQQAQQPSYQQPQYPAGSALAAMTPQGRAFELNQAEFAQRQMQQNREYGLQREEFAQRQKQFATEEQRRQQEFALRQSKMAQLQSTPEAALEAAKRLPYDPKTQVPTFIAHEGGYLPSLTAKAPQPFESGQERLAAERASKGIEGLDKEYNMSIAAEQSALLAEKAFKAGAKTGMFTGMTTLFKRAGEAMGMTDLGATDQILAQKGIAGLQQQGVRAVMQGLGSMSNADREFAIGAFPSITDSTLANKYFIELAKANAKFAKEDNAFKSKLERDGVGDAEILRQIRERRETRNIASDVYDKVMAEKNSEKTDQTKMDAEDQRAMKWANEHPQDPRAKRIKERLKL